MKQLLLYSIVPLLTGHADELCEDIRRQYENGISTCPLFMMTLVPEGAPAINKAKILCEKYQIFRDKLKAMGIPSGVLVQASIGHGWKLSEPFGFRKYTMLSNGYQPEIVCPYDEGFRAYMYDAMRTIASYTPDCIMLDDDFRLIGRGGKGCGCELHLKRFNELAGTSLCREELASIVTAGEDRRLIDIYIETQRESLVDTAKLMRKGIDSIDPSIPCSFCCVGNNAEFASEIARELAGEGNPIIVRMNNANYTSPGARNVVNSFQKAAAQISKLKGKVDVILAETDTCPQNRYSTSASMLHTHFSGSILEGAVGAKHWITRLHAYEPESGKAYRRMLAMNSGFYRRLAELVPQLKWEGFRIPVLDSAEYHFDSDSFDASVDGNSAWSNCFLGRLGLPIYYSSEDGGILCLDREDYLSDEQIKKALSGRVVLSSDAVCELSRRGFGEYIGVSAREWKGAVASNEIDEATENPMAIEPGLRELVPLSDKVSALSYVCHTVDEINYERLFPGVTRYENSLGGIVYAFCGTPRTSYSIGDAFSFLNQTRKGRLERILRDCSESAIFYPGDAEVYFRAAQLESDERFCAFFNIGLDLLDTVELISEREISEIKRIMPSGETVPVGFVREGESYTLELSCAPLDLLALIIS